MRTIPEFIVHYSRCEPFRSITGASENIRSEIIKGFSKVNAWGLSRFAHPEYLRQRLEIEKIIRDEFLSKGGKPILENPIYFFLGRNADFESHAGNRGKVFTFHELGELLNHSDFPKATSRRSFGLRRLRRLLFGYKIEMFSKN